MPEGDTLHRVALLLRPALVGQRLVSIERSRWVGSVPAPGETVVAIDAHGKWLRIEFSAGLVLLTHLRMNGAWQLYRRGERWRRPRGSMRVALVTDEFEAVCFAAPIVEFHSAASAQRRLGYLGPDLTTESPDIDAAVAGFATLDPATSIAEALLDQRVASGIGNVYKSEVCWFERIDPFSAVETVDPAQRRALVVRAHRLLRSNLGPGKRTTVGAGLAVYGRTGKGCLRCSTPIRSRVHTEHARRTYWCPQCQVAARNSAPSLGGDGSSDHEISK